MQKSIKNFILFAIMSIISSANAMNSTTVTTNNQKESKKQLNLSDFDIKKTESITRLTTLNFYKNNKKIAHSNYSENHGSREASVDWLQIYEREKRGSGLGKILALYIVSDLQKQNKNIERLRWTSAALDKEYMSQDNLDKFYQNLGGEKKFGFTFDLKKLKNTLFAPEKINNLKFSDMDVKKSSSLHKRSYLHVYPKNSYNSVAYIFLEQYFDDFDKDTMRVDIYVYENMRRQGLGKQLALYILKMIVNDLPSVKKITFYCPDKNLQVVLKKYGMEPNNSYGRYLIDIKDIKNIIKNLENTEKIDDYVVEKKESVSSPEAIAEKTNENSSLNGRYEFFIENDGIVSLIPHSKL